MATELEPETETPKSGPDSNSQTPKVPATKDKNCPFCGQAFTSSSLGRHLDLYIKEKNPKPPDGVHHVDEIRKIRGGITRRQTRVSGAKRGFSGTDTPTHRGFDGGSSVSGSPLVTADVNRGTPSGRRDGHSSNLEFNHFSWNTPGVVNGVTPGGAGDTPARIGPTSSRGGGGAEPKEATRREQLKAYRHQKQKDEDEFDTGRAAQLALQELLGSLKAAAQVKTKPTSLFDFNPYTLSFPALCLHILPEPTTLFSATPFSSADSWTLEPPGEAQYEALLRAIQIKVSTAQSGNYTHLSPPTNHSHSHGHGGFGQQSHNHLDRRMLDDPQATKLFVHCESAFAHWKSLPAQQQMEAWQLETLRALSRTTSRADESAKELAKVRTELAVTKDQLNALTVGTQPAEFSLRMPNSLASDVPESVIQAIVEDENLGLTFDDADYGRLLHKWRRVAAETRRATSGLEAQRTLSGESLNLGNTPNNTTATAAAATSPRTQPTGRKSGNLRSSRSGDHNAPEEPHLVNGVSTNKPSAGNSGNGHLTPTTHTRDAEMRDTLDEDERNTGTAGPNGSLEGNSRATVDSAGEIDADGDFDVDVDVDADGDGDVDVDGEGEETSPQQQNQQKGAWAHETRSKAHHHHPNGAVTGKKGGVPAGSDEGGMELDAL